MDLSKGLAIGVGILLWTGVGSPGHGAEPLPVAELQKQLAASVGLVRRRVARQLLEHGRDAAPAILALAQDQDVVVRRNAVRVLRGVLGEEAVPLYRRALQDPSPLVRMVAVEELIAYEPRTEAVKEALLQATSDADNEVRRLAAGTFWAFRRDYVPLRQRPNWDHAIEVVARQPLPADGWRFRTDPGRTGHVEQWFAPQADAGAWQEITIGKWWHEALPDTVGHFEGVAWYRLEFTAPEKPPGDISEVVLHFEAVDESTWLWVNGQYAGEHDLGPGGWDAPFDLEVGSFLKWGQPNQIAVRILNTAGAGGIYKPVELQVLK